MPHITAAKLKAMQDEIRDLRQERDELLEENAKLKSRKTTRTRKTTDTDDAKPAE